MSAATIYLVRHAEKPDPYQGTLGVDEDGSPDSHSLTPRGWQRAGALAVWFRNPSNARPVDRIYASRPEDDHDDGWSKSKRPIETVTPLAERDTIQVITRYTAGGADALGKELARMNGVTLVCWQHEELCAIVLAVAPGLRALPKNWPADRFDLVWILERDDAGKWTFDQRCQEVLEGDEGQTLPA